MTVIENNRPVAQRVDRRTDRRTDRRSLRILARSIARELTAEGLDAHALLALASELLSEATAQLRAARTARS
jgi:hypothetical protein